MKNTKKCPITQDVDCALKLYKLCSIGILYCQQALCSIVVVRKICTTNVYELYWWNIHITVAEISFAVMRWFYKLVSLLHRWVRIIATYIRSMPVGSPQNWRCLRRRHYVGGESLNFRQGNDQPCQHPITHLKHRWQQNAKVGPCSKSNNDHVQL